MVLLLLLLLLVLVLGVHGLKQTLFRRSRCRGNLPMAGKTAIITGEPPSPPGSSSWTRDASGPADGSSRLSSARTSVFTPPLTLAGSDRFTPVT